MSIHWPFRSVHRRAELAGVYVMDIADIITSDLESPASDETTEGGAPRLFGFTIVATEAVLPLYTNEKWRRDRMAEVCLCVCPCVCPRVISMVTRGCIV